MSYIQQSAGDGERVVALAHFHWLYSLKAYAILVVPLIILIIIRIYAEEPTRQWLSLAALLLGSVGLLTFLRMMIVRWTTGIGVTSHRFAEKSGWLSLPTNPIALPDIESGRVTQGFWGRTRNSRQLRV